METIRTPTTTTTTTKTTTTPTTTTTTTTGIPPMHPTRSHNDTRQCPQDHHPDTTRLDQLPRTQQGTHSRMQAHQHGHTPYHVQPGLHQGHHTHACPHQARAPMRITRTDHRTHTQAPTHNACSTKRSATAHSTNRCAPALYAIRNTFLRDTGLAP